MPGKSCAGWVYCVMSRACSKCFRMITMQKLIEQAIKEYQNLMLMHIHLEIKTFLLRGTPTMTVTKKTLLTQTAHSGLRIHAVNFLYP